MDTQEIRGAALPKKVKALIKTLRVPLRRVLTVWIRSTYSRYSAGDDGAQGFFVKLDLESGTQSPVLHGAFGGGALAGPQSPVDDQNDPQKPLGFGEIVIRGQRGSSDYASLAMTRMTLEAMIEGRWK